MSPQDRKRQKARRRKKLSRWAERRTRIVAPKNMHSNPYLLMYEGLHEGTILDQFGYRSGMDSEKCMALFSARNTLVSSFSWAVPTQEALEAIRDFSENSIVELGAGRGYWAALLKLMGVGVRAYDQYPPHKTPNYHCQSKRGNDALVPVYHPVKFGGPEMMIYHPHRVLMMIWPTYDDPWAFEAAKIYHEAGGTKIIFIGEGYGGCTADDGFFQYIAHHGDDTRMVYIPVWNGIHDCVQLITLKNNPEPFVVTHYCYVCEEDKARDGFKLVREEPRFDGATSMRKVEYCNDCYLVWKSDQQLPAQCG